MSSYSHSSRRSFSRRLLSVLLLAAFIIALFLLFHRTEAVGQSRRAQQVRYISVQIGEGDTLWDIATEYKSASDDLYHYMDSIREVNQMQSDTLISAQYLIIPLYS